MSYPVFFEYHELLYLRSLLGERLEYSDQRYKRLHRVLKSGNLDLVQDISFTKQEFTICQKLIDSIDGTIYHEYRLRKEGTQKT